MRTRTVLVERMRLCERAKADERNYCNFELIVNSKRDPFVVIVCCAVRDAHFTEYWSVGPWLRVGPLQLPLSGTHTTPLIISLLGSALQSQGLRTGDN